MSYSDTYGQVFNVQTLIDHAARRCGKLAEELTSEQLLTARESLGFTLTNLINIGIQYWAVKKEVIGLTPEKYIYTLPVGANDALNVLYRTMTRPSGSYASSAGGNAAFAGDSDVDTYCLQTSVQGNISIDFGTSNPIYAGSIGILPYVNLNGVTVAVWSFVFEYSIDGVTWSTLYDPGTVTVRDKQWLWYDIDPGQSVQYYRIRSTNPYFALGLREFYVGNNSREIQMARLNRDDYTNLPNKNFTANQPYQFWFNRTVPQPEIYLWPVPNEWYVQMTVWYSKQIMDVGNLTDELQIPQRWYLATVGMLAHQLSMELPAVPMERIKYLEDQAGKYLALAEAEERDRSPIYFAPNISVYTK